MLDKIKPVIGTELTVFSVVFVVLAGLFFFFTRLNVTSAVKMVAATSPTVKLRVLVELRAEFLGQAMLHFTLLPALDAVSPL